MPLEFEEEFLTLRCREERLPAAPSVATVPETVRSLFVVTTHDSPNGIGRAVHDEGSLRCREGAAGPGHEPQNLPVFPFHDTGAGAFALPHVFVRKVVGDLEVVGRHDTHRTMITHWKKLFLNSV